MVDGKCYFTRGRLQKSSVGLFMAWICGRYLVSIAVARRASGAGAQGLVARLEMSLDLMKVGPPTT
jgi:hypothetical protein